MQQTKYIENPTVLEILDTERAVTEMLERRER
jgi:hypothetical protein